MEYTTQDISKKKLLLPYKKYLAALVFSGYQFTDIISLVKEHGLSPFPKDIEGDIFVITTEYNSKYTNVENYPKDIKLMMDYLMDMPTSRRYLKEVFELLGDITMRKWINALRLGNLDSSTIYLTVNTKSDKIYDEQTFDYYINYFFNLEGFSAKDKYMLVTSENDAELKKFYELAIKYDKEELLWELGFTPELSIDQIIKSVAAESLMRLKKSKDDDTAARLGTLAIRAAEKLKEMDIEKQKGLQDALGFDFKVLSEKPELKKVIDLNKE